ncbi:MAG: hypothetical protein ABIR83_08365 [Nakamurella sp.]
MDTTRAAMFLAVAVALAGCFGDPPPDPATAGLEVVIEGCVLNRPEVAPGTHDVVVINHDKHQPGRLVVSDQVGAEVLVVAVGERAQLVTTDQTYTFTCSAGGDQNASTLESKGR